jgi:hypothetical protein
VRGVLLIGVRLWVLRRARGQRGGGAFKILVQICIAFDEDETLYGRCSC